VSSVIQCGLEACQDVGVRLFIHLEARFADGVRLVFSSKRETVTFQFTRSHPGSGAMPRARHLPSMPPKFLFLLAVFPAYQIWDIWQLHGAVGVNYHLLAETAATVVFLWILTVVWRERRRTARELAELKTSRLAGERAAQERDATARQSTRDFLKQMQAQFEAWRLTPAEKEVALLLVKGLSLEAIAGLRESGAKTVRQHAANIYAKAKLEGRHQLAAYFLEDLMAPVTVD
jgi:DNA-binding CsgD family transcriptional regulator